MEQLKNQEPGKEINYNNVKKFIDKLDKLGIIVTSELTGKKSFSIYSAIKNVKGWAAGSDTENWEIEYINIKDDKGVIAGYACGDWQDDTSWTLTIPLKGNEKPSFTMFEKPHGKGNFKSITEILNYLQKFDSSSEKVNESITSNAKFFTVICDRCGINKVIKCTSIEDAKEKLIEDGWDISSCNNCMCPQCCDEYNNELQQEENDYFNSLAQNYDFERGDFKY